MHVGREPLLMDDFSPERSQQFALFARESRTKVRFMLGGQLGKFFQHAPTASGQDKLGMASIFRAALPFDQALSRQLINQDDHATREHAEFPRQGALIAQGSFLDDAQDSGMAWGKVQFFDALAKTISGVRAELSEKKSGASWPWFTEFHKWLPAS